MTSDWHTPAELAARYKVSLRSIYRAISSREIVHHKLAGCIRISEAERVAWEERQQRAKLEVAEPVATRSRPMSREKRAAAMELGLI